MSFLNTGGAVSLHMPTRSWTYLKNVQIGKLTKKINIQANVETDISVYANPNALSLSPSLPGK